MRDVRLLIALLRRLFIMEGGQRVDRTQSHLHVQQRLPRNPATGPVLDLFTRLGAP